MNEKNFALLTQEEIDTLVRFLVDKKEFFKNEVLPQNSIDKLLRLLREHDKNRLRPDAVILQNKKVRKLLLDQLGVNTDDSQVCRFDARQNKETSFIEIYAVNTANGKEQKVTPDNFADYDFNDSDSVWGYSIVPVFFDEVASVYGLKYTKETYDFIYNNFMKINFGENVEEICQALLPSNEQLLENLL